MTDLFEELWKSYPRRTEKKYAKKMYERALEEGADPAVIIRGANNYSLYCKQQDTEQRYIKHLSTWLNKGCWEDELELKPIETVLSVRVGESMSQAKSRIEREGLSNVRPIFLSKA